MENDIKISVVGGDGRYRWAAEEFKNAGYSVMVYGVSGMKNTTQSLVEALDGAEILLLSMRPLEDGSLRVGEEQIDAILLPDLLAPGAILAAGQLPDKLAAWLEDQGVVCLQFLEQEKYLLQNASVTAEAAIELILRELDSALAGSRVLLAGWGRIGKFLSEKLRALGANVTVAVRRQEQKDLLEVLGFETEHLGNCHGTYDVIVNTVSAEVFTEAKIEELGDSDCVLLELASQPGGFSKGLGNKVVDGRGLPGKSVPKTAGKQLAVAVMDFYRGEGRNLE